MEQPSPPCCIGTVSDVVLWPEVFTLFKQLEQFHRWYFATKSGDELLWCSSYCCWLRKIWREHSFGSFFWRRATYPLPKVQVTNKTHNICIYKTTNVCDKKGISKAVQRQSNSWLEHKTCSPRALINMHICEVSETLESILYWYASNHCKHA